MKQSSQKTKVLPPSDVEKIPTLMERVACLRVSNLPLSMSRINSLIENDCIFITDLLVRTEEELLSTSKLSDEGVREVKEALAHMGLQLKKSP